jgi:putative endonuclease
LYPRHQFGKESEFLAREWFLQQKGYRFLENNYRCRWGEIDLIFEFQSSEISPCELVFVEVRSRAERAWVSPVESLDWRKQKRLQKTAHHFISQYRGSARSMRFDLLFRQGSDWGYLPNLWFA